MKDFIGQDITPESFVVKIDKRNCQRSTLALYRIQATYVHKIVAQRLFVHYYPQLTEPGVITVNTYTLRKPNSIVVVFPHIEIVHLFNRAIAGTLTDEERVRIGKWLNRD